jgi:hypothetical protein
MLDPTLAHLIASLLLALITGTWQPVPAEFTRGAVEPVQFTASWHPLDLAGNEQDVIVIGADGNVFAGATSSAVSPARH